MGLFVLSFCLEFYGFVLTVCIWVGKHIAEHWAMAFYCIYWIDIGIAQGAHYWEIYGIVHTKYMGVYRAGSLARPQTPTLPGQIPEHQIFC